MLEVASVAVLPAGSEPVSDGPDGPDQGTPADCLPGIKDEHDDGTARLREAEDVAAGILGHAQAVGHRGQHRRERA